MNERIAIIEDEKNISRFIELELTHEGYQVAMAFDGREGLELLEGGGFDLALLDIMMPGLNGMEVLRRLRQTSDLPVIMLTARDAVIDKVSGLDMGADDYITKPFAIEELLARIRVVLRKRAPSQPAAAGVLNISGLVLEPGTRSVSCDGKRVELTKKEFDLLQYLMENRNLVLTRERILEHVWGYDYAGETNVVDVYIRYLRAKIDVPMQRTVISTVRGVGYAVRDD